MSKCATNTKRHFAKGTFKDLTMGVNVAQTMSSLQLHYMVVEPISEQYEWIVLTFRTRTSWGKMSKVLPSLHYQRLAKQVLIWGMDK